MNIVNHKDTEITELNVEDISDIEEKPISEQEVEKIDYLSLYNELQEEHEKLKNQSIEAEKNLNQQFLDLINKKSQEASEILKTKSLELEEKYKKEFDEKLMYFYEDGFSDLVLLISQLSQVIAVKNPSPELQNYLIGFQMLLSQFRNLLNKFNIEEVIPEINSDFDSNFMVSTKTEEVSDESKKNKVIEVFSSAFKLKERMIKLAEVLVGL